MRITVLPSPGPAEQARLAAAHERRQEVDHLDARLEDFRPGRQVGHRGRLAVDGPVVLGLDRPAAVDHVAGEIEHAAERTLADRHLDGRAGIEAFHAADHAVGVAQGHAADPAAAQVLLHLAGQIQRDALLLAGDLHGVVDRRQAVFGKLNVERRADDLRHAADVLGGSRIWRSAVAAGIGVHSRSVLAVTCASRTKWETGKMGQESSQSDVPFSRFVNHVRASRLFHPCPHSFASIPYS